MESNFINYSDTELRVWAREHLTYKFLVPLSPSERVALIEAAKDTQRQLMRLQATLAPIRVLPRDIMVLILREHLCSTQVSDPTRLGVLEVCKLWREIAINEPTCWTVFDTGYIAYYPNITSSDMLRVREKLRLQARYARKALINISISIALIDENYWTSDTTAILTPEYYQLFRIFTSISYGIASLQIWEGWYGPALLSELNNSGSCLANLTHLTLGGDTLTKAISMPKLSLYKLRSLFLYQQGETFQILSSIDMPELIYLGLIDCILDLDHVDRHTSLENLSKVLGRLSKLSTLVVCSNTIHDMSLPYRYWSSDGCREVTTKIASIDSVQEISIVHSTAGYNALINTEALHTWLNLFPSLTQLRVDDEFLINNIAVQLSRVKVFLFALPRRAFDARYGSKKELQCLLQYAGSLSELTVGVDNPLSPFNYLDRNPDVSIDSPYWHPKLFQYLQHGITEPGILYCPNLAHIRLVKTSIVPLSVLLDCLKARHESGRSCLLTVQKCTWAPDTNSVLRHFPDVYELQFPKLRTIIDEFAVKPPNFAKESRFQVE